MCSESPRFTSFCSESAASSRYFELLRHSSNCAALSCGSIAVWSKTRRSGSRNGSERSRRALTTLKTPVLAPMATASASTANPVCHGRLAQSLRACFASCNTSVAFFIQTEYIEEAPLLNREPQNRFATGAGLSVAQAQCTAVGFGDLAADDEADAGAATFGGKERNEQIGGVGETRAFVAHDDFDI